MILLCSSDQNVLNRWNGVLGSNEDVQYAMSIDDLKKKLQISTPDLLLLHLSVSGIHIDKDIEELQQSCTGLKIMTFADRPDDVDGVALLKRGVFCYSNTYMSESMLLKVVDIVKSGEVWVGEKLAQFLIKNLHAGAQSKPTTEPEKLSRLTVRERELALLVSEGESNKQIAAKLEITERTVKAHLGMIFRKTETTDRLQLALYVNGYRD